jgi:hypothetical protein
MEVELVSTKSYNDYDHEDNDWRLKEALAKARKARGEYTEEESNRGEEFEDGHCGNEDVNDLWIMGTD